MRLRETAFKDPRSFFHRYSELSADAARAIAENLWHNINLRNPARKTSCRPGRVPT